MQEEPTGVQEEPIGGWHLKKEIQISHLISTALVAVSAFAYIGEIKKDVEILKVQMAEQRERDKAQDVAMSAQSILIEQRLDRLESKIDRLIERKSKP
jgi:hypothetical protein